MRLHEHSRAKAFQKLAGSVELENGRLAAMEHPEVSMGIRLHGE
jgi:hypothetical protein